MSSLNESNDSVKSRKEKDEKHLIDLNSDENNLDENNISDAPIERDGVVSICGIELLVDEDKIIPDSKLPCYNIEEEYIGFGMGVSFNCERMNSSSKNINVYDGSSIRLCYTNLWRKLPHNIPVREIVMSRYHISVLLNNGHVYTTLSDMNGNLDNNSDDLRRSYASSLDINKMRERRNRNNGNNVSSLENSISRSNWLHIKELDDKNIRGIKISSVMLGFDQEPRHDLKSFVLASLTNEGNIWITEYSSIDRIIRVKLISLSVLNELEHFDFKSSRVIDVTLSELRPITQSEIKEDNLECENEINMFPYSYGMSIVTLLNDNHSNSIILKKNISKDNELFVLDLPFACRKIYCGLDIEYGLILLQNGILWRWDFRKDCLNNSSPVISDNNDSDEVFVRNINLNQNSVLKLDKIQGSLSNKKIIDFSGLNGEFIALTQDGFIHEWNDKDRTTLFRRPFIKDPIIFTPKYHYKVVKKYVSNNNLWSFKNMSNLDDCKSNSPTNSCTSNLNESFSQSLLDNEIQEMYNPRNKIIGVWLLEGVTLILHKDSTLRSLYNYIGRDGYNTKIGFVSEDDGFVSSSQILPIINCIKWSYKLGKCIPANPIALIGLLSNFGKCKALHDKEKQLIIQRSLVKLSLRDKPVYRILACYNSVIFGILRPNAKWRPNKSNLIRNVSDIQSGNDEMNISTTVELKNCRSNKFDKKENSIQNNDKTNNDKLALKDFNASNSNHVSSTPTDSSVINGIQSIDTNFTSNSTPVVIELVNCEKNDTEIGGRVDKKPISNDSRSVKTEKSKTQSNIGSKIRKRERRHFSRNNKENVDDSNCPKHLCEENSSWESKKLSLVEYEVEQILSIREKPLTKRKEYLIKWKVPGHPVQPTWEPEENLNGCEELVQEFLKSIKTSRSGRLLLPCTTLTKNI